MAINASFTPSLLSVSGDNLGNASTTSRDTDGKHSRQRRCRIHHGGQPTVPNTTEIVEFGGNGNDTISLGNAVPPLQAPCSVATATTC